jgi:hypothetical protein
MSGLSCCRQPTPRSVIAQYTPAIVHNRKSAKKQIRKAFGAMLYSRIMAEEQEITTGRSTETETRIDVGEDPEEEKPECELDENIAAIDKEGGDGCPIVMGEFGRMRCGRRVHAAPEGVDEKPVCLMHSKNPRKRSGQLFEMFWLEFERILESAGENEASFEHFVFPSVHFSGRKFQATCRFDLATFSQDVRFDFAVFTRDASFCNATFEQDAHFWDVTFTNGACFGFTTFAKRAFFCRSKFLRDAEFTNSTFSEVADFRTAIIKQAAQFDRATFTLDANFQNAIFELEARFSGTDFNQNADFKAVSFGGKAIFGNAHFLKGADFTLATFTQDANFMQAIFSQGAIFRSATFNQKANFRRAAFTESAYFNEAIFTLSARFLDTSFQGTASWRGSRFFDKAEFRRIHFNPKVEGHESACFSLAAFHKPAEVVFDEVDLSRAFFHDCDISQVWFTSSVRWATRGDGRGFAVYEETIPLREYRAIELSKSGNRDHGAVAQIYQQLKKNYDSRLDYWTGNQFHFAEMEMKRLAVPKEGRLLGLRRWFYHRGWGDPRMALLALYRYASDYGNSYWKPMFWLLVTVALFGAMLPVPGVGLNRQGTGQSETYASEWRVVDHLKPNLWAEIRLVGKGVITSVDTATLQKDPEYAPAYPWGRVLAIFETLVTSTLFALFLLAIRRQFRR